MFLLLPSESSLFVGERELMLKTCGQTRLLEAVQPLLDLAVKSGFSADEASIFYSRKDYLHPELQKSPQGLIQREFQFLDKMFNGKI